MTPLGGKGFEPYPHNRVCMYRLIKACYVNHDGLQGRPPAHEH